MKITLPLSVTLPRKTKADRVWILNFNSYRNTHFHILNQAKIAYKDLIVVAGLMPMPPYRFKYTIYPVNHRKFDLGNVLPVVAKFAEDALIEYGILSDDNYKIIREVIYDVGFMDKDNPRVELVIESF